MFSPNKRTSLHHAYTRWRPSQGCTFTLVNSPLRNIYQTHPPSLNWICRSRSRSVAYTVLETSTIRSMCDLQQLGQCVTFIRMCACVFNHAWRIHNNNKHTVELCAHCQQMRNAKISLRTQTTTNQSRGYDAFLCVCARPRKMCENKYSHYA